MRRVRIMSITHIDVVGWHDRVAIVLAHWCDRCRVVDVRQIILKEGRTSLQVS